MSSVPGISAAAPGELMLDDGRSYVNVWQYRSAGQRLWGSCPYPDKNGSIGMFINKGELSDPPPERLSIIGLSFSMKSTSSPVTKEGSPNEQLSSVPRADAGRSSVL